MSQFSSDWGATQLSQLLLSIDSSPRCAPTLQEIQNFFKDGTLPQSLAGMYDTCSMGQVQLDTNATVVVNVPFPCNGTLADGSQFSTNTCDNNNVVQWQVWWHCTVTHDSRLIAIGKVIDSTHPTGRFMRRSTSRTPWATPSTASITGVWPGLTLGSRVAWCSSSDRFADRTATLFGAISYDQMIIGNVS